MIRTRGQLSNRPPGPRKLPCGKRIKEYENCLTYCPGKLSGEVRKCYYGWLRQR